MKQLMAAEALPIAGFLLLSSCILEPVAGEQ